MVTGVRHLFFCIVMVTVFSSLVRAAEAQKSDTVVNRARPELRALGISAGSFLVYPEFGLTGVVNDNIFATNERAQDDFVTIISPGLSVNSNWNNHALNAKASADIGRYQDFDSEDFEDYEISGDGQYNVSKDINLDAGVTTGRYHQDRFSQDDNLGLVPTIYTKDELFARYGHKRGKYNFTLEANFNRVDYDDVPGFINGAPTIIDQDYRDRDERVVQLREAYEYLSGSNVYLSLKKIRWDYDNLPRDESIERSSGGHEIVVGGEFASNEMITGDIFVGVSELAYSPPQDDIKEPVLGANLDWSITTLTTIGLNIDYLLWPTTSRNFVAYESTSAGITIDHELSRNLILNAGFTRAENSYTGIGRASREDSLFEVKTGVRYMANRHFSVTGEYIHLQRDSIDNTLPAFLSRNVSRNILYFQIQAQY
jgi:hypothetical protein